MAENKIPCPHCGVLFRSNNLPMHIGAKHREGSTSAAPVTPKPAAQTRSRAPRATAPAPQADPAAAPAKKDYDVLDPEIW